MKCVVLLKSFFVITGVYIFMIKHFINLSFIVVINKLGAFALKHCLIDLIYFLINCNIYLNVVI